MVAPDTPFRCMLFFFISTRPPPISTLFPYTTLFRSACQPGFFSERPARPAAAPGRQFLRPGAAAGRARSEEHTSELQSRENLVCRLLLEKKNTKIRK